MKIFWRSRAWYGGGLAFECARCGQCCAGPGEGYVWVRREEIEAIAEFLQRPVEEICRLYVRRVSGRYSLMEDAGSRDCVFLRYDGEGRSQCRVYPVRPTQCRTWPFWPGNLATPDDWSLAARRCPGINRGAIHEFDEIQRKRQQVNP